jgi:hypothetical protein
MSATLEQNRAGLTNYTLLWAVINEESSQSYSFLLQCKTHVFVCSSMLSGRNSWRSTPTQRVEAMMDHIQTVHMCALLLRSALGGISPHTHALNWKCYTYDTYRRVSHKLCYIYMQNQYLVQNYVTTYLIPRGRAILGKLSVAKLVRSVVEFYWTSGFSRYSSFTD